MTFLRLLAVGRRGRFAGVVDGGRGVDQCGMVLTVGGEPLLVGAFQIIHATGQKVQLRFCRARSHYISVVAIQTGAHMEDQLNSLYSLDTNRDIAPHGPGMPAPNL